MVPRRGNVIGQVVAHEKEEIMAIGEYFRKIRRKKRVRQEDIEGVPRRTLYNLERSQRPPSWKTIHNLAKSLRIALLAVDRDECIVHESFGITVIVCRNKPQDLTEFEK